VQRGVVEPDFKASFEQTSGLYMVLGPNLRVVAASDAYLQETLTRRADILGIPYKKLRLDIHIFGPTEKQTSDSSKSMIIPLILEFHPWTETIKGLAETANPLLVYVLDVRSGSSKRPVWPSNPGPPLRWAGY
jgi:hypothetical protein